MRVLFVINAMGRGGAEIQVRDLALALVSRWHEVAMCVLLPFEDFEDELRDGGVRTMSLGLSKGKATLRALRELAEFIDDFDPTVIHAHMFAATFAARCARPLLRSRAPLVNTAHIAFEARRRYVAYRLTHRLSDVFTFVSQEALDRHAAGGALPKRDGVVVPNGVDLRKFRKRTEADRSAARAKLGLSNTFHWVAIGSLRDEQKDYSNLLAAFARLPDRDARLLIVGEGRTMEAKRAEAGTLGVGDRVEFLGLRADVDELLRAADGYVMSSAWEGLPIVLLEAAATGLPIVATDVGANGDVVAGTGKVVPPKSPTALAEAMTAVMRAAPAEREAMGASAHRRAVERFDLASVVGQWERLYQDAAEARLRSDATSRRRSA